MIVGKYILSEHPDLPDDSKVFWIEDRETGEGTTVRVEELFEWAM